MDNFVVSARKYRPATFDTVVGQLPITSTLKNAISSKHLAQAFLFCGPRGVGKTTCARILAKTINCESVTATTEPCNKCESCVSFNSGHSLNIFELDAASNNSVDGIRALIDSVRFAPQIGTYKVYIIDEVHMLSASAFNAFLKTLEEPPSHAVFILATTEKHKIIPTILSRCQIFDFSRITVKDIAGYLQKIAKNEGLDAEPDALHILALKADGAMRDALSMFDQIVSFSGNKILYKSVIDNLNILDYEYYFESTEQIISHNIPSALMLFDEVLRKGFDGNNFITGLAEHLRNLMVCKDASTLPLLESGETLKEKYKEQSAKCTASFLLDSLSIINNCDINYKMSKNQRLLTELALMQLCSLGVESEKKKDSSTVKILPPLSVEPASGRGGTLTVQTSAKIPTQKEIISTRTETLPRTDGRDYSSLQQEHPVVLKSYINPATISISGVMAGVGRNNGKEDNTRKMPDKQEENAEDTETSQTDAGQIASVNLFTQEGVEKAFADYAALAKKSGKENLYVTLTKHLPLLKNNFLVELTIENKVQEETILREKSELLSYLKSSLKNEAIQINTVIPKMSSNTTPYTTREKYLKMAEKNPVLNKLRQKLDLDVG